MDSGVRWARCAATIALAFAATSAAAAFAASIFWRKSRCLASRVRELERELNASLEKTASERRGRIRCQQSLRKGLTQERSDESGSASSSYPMTPIGFVKSCFSTRNGTPRQPLLVPLAKACLLLDPSRIPQEAFEGLAEYSHCWILYVFHLNTDLEKLWKQHSRSKFKAKVRVPRLKGGKMGVLATRSPHRPCPIGLTVAKVDALDGRSIILSGVDLVDGTPVLDIKPYLPYSDCIQGATVPKWIEVNNSLAVASVNFSSDFSSSLASSWENAGGQSLYSRPDELQSLIKQVLSWDIRSLSQRSRPHPSVLQNNSIRGDDFVSDVEDDSDWNGGVRSSSSSSDGCITYHLILEGVDISYKIDDNSNIMVEKATLSSNVRNNIRSPCNFSFYRNKLGQP